jgi:hypothetical protein
MPNSNQKNSSPVKTVRGESQLARIMDSESDGEEFRAAHDGQDVRVTSPQQDSMMARLKKKRDHGLKLR